MDMYRISPQAVLAEFDTESQCGLSSSRIPVLRERYGLNRLEGKPPRPAWIILLAQFRDVMILILMAAAVISGLLGDLTDTVIIFVIVVLNALLGFYQEYRAERALDALQRMTSLQAQVIRDGLTIRIDSAELVPGDIVLLEAGNSVPADLRLLEVHALRIDESALTGESVPVDKRHEALDAEDVPLGDRSNMAYKGTLVTNGRAVGLVVATAMSTEIGRIARMLESPEVETPLQKRMADFGRKLSYIILVICLILLGVGLLRGEEPMKMLLLSISLAVAAIPEALPALITIALSMGAHRLVKKHALIRKLPAVETLGSVTYICTDKTGTLTQNKMQVVQLRDAGQPSLLGFDDMTDLSGLMVLNHDVSEAPDGGWQGDPTETAIVDHIVQKQGRSAYLQVREGFPRVAEIPFDSDRKCMTTIHRMESGFLVVTKGAVETLLEALSDSKDKDLIHQEAQTMAAEGIRVIAFGYCILRDLPESITHDRLERNLIYAGLVGLMDPARPEVRDAIAECHSAGIHTVMITGDHPATAAAVARDIGLLNPGDLVINGRELGAMSQEAFEDVVEKVRVYARVSPEQKLRIVQALQRQRHFVAMTGDGVNDAPSLKAADIGIAMGINGTDVSREAARMILLDDHFTTIVRAVREGRRIFDNIRKFVKYIMTCNGAEIWTILLAPLLGLPIPLLPIHLLWINLVTDGLPGLALARERAEADIMHRPPRRSDESIFANGIGFHILWVGLLMAGVTLSAQAWAINQQLEHWQTMVFTILAFAQLGHVLAIRSERQFLFRQGLLSNIPLLGAVLLTIALQFLVIYLPAANEVFHTQPLSLREILICVAAAAVVFHAVELEKLIRRTIMKRRRTGRKALG
jgi:Ca2+-transporting ATPase